MDEAERKGLISHSLFFITPPIPYYFQYHFPSNLFYYYKTITYRVDFL
ncbi:hypothetical protein QW060_02835 [Myroides ceti]|uniref:Uncharacterized protein n=1 Tax=Paenimyroides ceti TaxID=395087 RepID=A0ABT8CPI0_9FLAO|nr:hypothetical protein [Paenimyroides ceti]MDN3706061.1 hypothetical protein [Paenimyroides ceti]